MANSHQTRRTFIRTLTGTLLAFFLLGKFLMPRSQAKKPLIRLGRHELPTKGALVFQEARLAIMNDGGKPYALSLVCTHLGCTVNVTPDGLVCPCHGSRFDRRGKVLEGPADRPLMHYTVEETEEGFVVVA